MSSTLIQLVTTPKETVDTDAMEYLMDMLKAQDEPRAMECVRLISEGKNTSKLVIKDLVRTLQLILHSLTTHQTRHLDLAGDLRGMESEEDALLQESDVSRGQKQVEQEISSTPNPSVEGETQKADGRSQSQLGTRHGHHAQYMGEFREKEETPMCRLYLENRCRYGEVGQGCRFRHPKKCAKFVRYGLKKYNYQGCEKSTGCKWAHPKACFSSLRKGECLRANCKFFHIQGTKRAREQTSHTSSMSGNRIQTQPWCGTPSSDKPEGTAVFLWMERRLKESTEKMMECLINHINERLKSTVRQIPDLQNQPNRVWQSQY
jgi:hypothetical protein